MPKKPVLGMRDVIGGRVAEIFPSAGMHAWRIQGGQPAVQLAGCTGKTEGRDFYVDRI